MDVQIISDLHKSEVFCLGRYLALPATTLDPPPTGDLYNGLDDEACADLSRDVRSAAAAATADFAVDPEGREILRREGALRPLVLLVEEGIDSPAAEQAAKALMTLAASEINKVCHAMLHLLYTLRCACMCGYSLHMFQGRC